MKHVLGAESVQCWQTSTVPYLASLEKHVPWAMNTSFPHRCSALAFTWVNHMMTFLNASKTMLIFCDKIKSQWRSLRLCCFTYTPEFEHQTSRCWSTRFTDYANFKLYQWKQMLLSNFRVFVTLCRVPLKGAPMNNDNTHENKKTQFAFNFRRQFGHCHRRERKQSLLR